MSKQMSKQISGLAQKKSTLNLYGMMVRGVWLTDLFPRVAEADVRVSTVVVLALCLRDVLLRERDFVLDNLLVRIHFIIVDRPRAMGV